MSITLKSALFGALCGAFMFAVAAPASAGPSSIPSGTVVGLSSQVAAAYYKPHCKKCRHCVKWKTSCCPKKY